MHKLLPLFACLFCLSCGDNRQVHQEPQHNVPEALDNNKARSYGFSKSSPRDVVDRLFDELIENDTALQTLHERISSLKREKGDSLYTYHKFSSNNEDFYSSAKMHLNNVRDSSLRSTLKSMVNTSELKYKQKKDRFIKSESLIDTSIVQINDRLELLKMLMTIPVMERYQRDNLPSEVPFDSLLKKMQQLRAKLEIAIKKNGG
jgi:hypothetical protein